MITYLNNSSVAAVVLHEIYGLNQHIKDICLELSEKHIDVFAPDMLPNRRVFNCSQENSAYNNFYNCVGLERAFGQVRLFLNSIRSRYKKIFVIGFSVGATVAWLCSQESELCDGIIGFYGSRIRDYREIEPECPVLLFFPYKEKSFNVSEFVDFIKSKNKVCVQQLNCLHGFTNPASPNYNRELTHQSYKKMLLFMKNCASN